VIPLNELDLLFGGRLIERFFARKYLMTTAQLETVPVQPCTSDAPLFKDTLPALNRCLDDLNLPYDINESIIEEMLKSLEAAGSEKGPAYWLILGRIMELALVAAGHYADHCEFSAAGDLLVNPRTIRVGWKGQRFWVVKNRHGKMSDQFRGPGMSRENFVRDFKENGSLETLRPALLPYLLERMKACGRFSSDYLEGVDARMKKIADTMGFLCAGGINTGQQLYIYLNRASASDRKLVAANLCRFDRRRYDHIGREVDRWRNGKLFTSVFLSPETMTRWRAAAMMNEYLQ